MQKDLFISTKFLNPPLVTGDVIGEPNTLKEVFEISVQNIDTIRGLGLLNCTLKEVIWIRLNSKNCFWFVLDLETGKFYNKCVKTNPYLFLNQPDMRDVICNILPVIKTIFENEVFQPFTLNTSQSSYLSYGLVDSKNQVYVYFEKPVFVIKEPEIVVTKILYSTKDNKYPTVCNISYYLLLYEQVDISCFNLTIDNISKTRIPYNSWLKHFIPTTS